MRKRVFVGAGYNTRYFGSGRLEFDPQKPMPPFEEYLKETAHGTCAEVPYPLFDEGVIGSFMSGRFLKQANLPGFLPFMIPSLAGKPCTGVEGACGTGGRAIAMAVRSILSDLSDTVFVAAFEMQNSLKSLYGADVLAGAGYYRGERKGGYAHFFPGIFAERAGAYFEKYGKEEAIHAMAYWYQQMILNARQNPKAQEYHNRTEDLLALGMAPPDPKHFVPYLNPAHCSKITDGASSLLVLSEEGVKRSGIVHAVELVGLGEAESDITAPPGDLTKLSTTEIAVQKALQMASIGLQDLGLLEIHDCFAITALLAFEAIGLARRGEAPQFILADKSAKTGLVPTNLSGGLIGFGHPTGASGVRQMVDLIHQLTGQAAHQVTPKTPYGMMISMGGNDKTVTCLIVSKCSFPFADSRE